MKDDKKQSARQEKVSKWRKFARKRWVYPAVYLGLAAIVIAAVLWMQVGGVDKNNYSIDHPKTKNPVAYNHNPSSEQAAPVNAMKQTFEWPVEHQNAVHVQKKFWDANASVKDQSAALVLNNNTYRPNTGINLATKSGDSFAVTAAMEGTVVQAEKDPDLGYVVRVDDGNGITTLYSSLKSLAVEQGDLVKQGQKLGMAGKSDYFGKDAGVILHFEIRANGTPVNPVAYFGKTKSQLLDEVKADQKDNKDSKDQNKNGQTEKKKDQGTSGSGNQGNTEKQKQDSQKDSNGSEQTSTNA